jgi:uncharacterized protein (TIGR02186 family)
MRALALPRRAALIAAILGALLAAAWPASAVRADALIASLSTHRVLIGSNYTGAQIAVFGSVEREGRSVARAAPNDVIITVMGPRRHLLVREKDQRGIFWLNREQRRYGEAPAFMTTYFSRTLPEIGTEEDLRRLQVGLKNKLTPAGAGASFDPDETRFTEALIRLKTADRLYAEVERGVTFLTPGLFRALVELPASAPPGNYDVTIELISGSVLLARQQTSFEVVQIGFEQQVAWLARNWAFAYGLATALTALLFGWLATVIFRRD